MKRRLLTILLVTILALSITTSALAQDYFFQLEREVVNVYWNSDGTMSLDYQFTFDNQPSGHAIEFVDVSSPKGRIDMSSVSADVDGNLVRVSASEYQGTGTGFAVIMGPYAIPPGETGNLHVYIGRITDVVYPDENDENYASAVFAPAYFLSSVTTGTTDLTVIFHLPPGVQPERGGEGPRRAGVQAAGAGPAAVFLRWVRLQLERGDDLAQKNPVPQRSADEVGVFADEAQPGALGEIPFEQRAGIDIPERASARAAELDCTVGQRLQPLAQDIVVVGVTGVAGDKALRPEA